MASVTGSRVDFGVGVSDYLRHRPGFPPSLFDRLGSLGIGRPGRRLLDLGTGTGTLARGLGRQGALVTGLDVSSAMLAGARTAALADGLPITFVRAAAEATPFRAASFDAVVAGQCWHWFDGPRAGREVAGLLRPGGLAIVAAMDYDTGPGSLGGATEAVILRHNLGWKLAGHRARFEGYTPHLANAGLEIVETIVYEEAIRFTRQSWRGRIRSCNALVTLPAAAVLACDAEIARMLERDWPEPLDVQHHILAIVARRP